MLICVVEAWTDSGDPSPVARLAQIRALMELRSFDRAWARLKPLLESGKQAEVFRLAGRMLLDRGEVKDARTTLTKGRHLFEDDAEIQKLLEQADEPRTGTDDLTDPMEDDADGQAVLAERMLIEGAPLKARRILERVRKSNPDHTRTSDLLWALDGDFRLRGVTLSDLARVHAMPTQSLVDLPEDTDHTMESDDPTAEELEASAAFPTLFKNLEEQTEAYGLVPSDSEPEVTQVSSMAADAGESHEVTQETTREDTQIMTVVRTTGHTPDSSAAETLIDGAFDLKAHERSLRGESEDENVILRKSSAERTITETDAGDRIKLDPSRDRVQSGANKVDEGAEFIRPRKKPQVTVEAAPPRPKAEKKPSALASPKKKTPPPAKRAATPEPADRKAPERPRLQAAPSGALPPPSQAVTLQRLPTDERPIIDPMLAAAPTEILEDPDAPLSRRPAFAPWTGWLLVFALLALIVLSMGSLLILYQVVSSW